MRKLLIVLTDGSQTKYASAEDPGNVAIEIAKSGIHVIVIGIGRGIDRRELDHMAGGPGKALVAQNFDELISSEFIQRIIPFICVPQTGKLILNILNILPLLPYTVRPVL